MSVQILFSLLLKIALMIAMGYVLFKKGLITEAFKKQLSFFLIDVVMPICILSTGNIPFSRELLANMLLCAVISLMYYGASIVVLRLFLRKASLPKEEKALVILVDVFANTAFMGFPIVLSLLGEEGMLYAIIYNISFNIFMFSYGKTLVKGKANIDFKEILLDPSMIASFLFILIFVSPLSLPSVLWETMDMISAMMVPMSMIIIGCNLAASSVKDILCSPLCYLSSFIRLIALPLAMMAVVKAFHIQTVLAAALVILTSLPSAAMNVILAEQYECRPELASDMVIHTMVFGSITLPVLLLMCSRLL